VNFLAPLALWGLLAGLVPLGLHLRRRRVGRTIQVGSLKHLETLPTAERRGHRLRDPLRLLLRLATLGALVLSLAGPAIPPSPDDHDPFIVADSLTPEQVIDSLRQIAEVHLERLDDPWSRARALDDSLPPGMPLLVAPSPRSDLYAGPRPVAGRQIGWYPNALVGERTPSAPPSTAVSPALASGERRALDAALAVTSEEFGPLDDTIGWTTRLPAWWRDSLNTAAFPLAVARAVAPARALPPSVDLGTAQLRPRQTGLGSQQPQARDLHWWPWSVAILLFLLERLWARRLPEEG